ncbi:MAG: nitroreductase family protein [Candidatus Latescibacterota bacterium]
MNILEAISRRVSVRNFQPEPAEETILEEVRRSGETAEALTGADMQFNLRADAEVGCEVTAGFGDYGRFIRAPHYIILAARESAGYMVDSGYRFEQMVLEATRRNLGTCWIGGMFKETPVRNALGLDDSWRIIALTPVGHTASPGLVSRTLKAMAGSSQRKPFSEIFFWQRHGEPLSDDMIADDRLVEMLEATRWAPSWGNRQPWRFILKEREILVYKQTSQIKEGKDYHLLDCGIAMVHLLLAGRELGLDGHWELAEFEVPGALDAEPVGRYILDSPLGAES